MEAWVRIPLLVPCFEAFIHSANGKKGTNTQFEIHNLYERQRDRDSGREKFTYCNRYILKQLFTSVSVKVVYIYLAASRPR